MRGPGRKVTCKGGETCHLPLVKITDKKDRNAPLYPLKIS